ncbi:MULTISPECIES: hypothetical protein [Actinomadura]|uniref:Uncharacterized protein n=1 Tax=Actinomadura yumaensis TaxID=111807 RepID=A0ABW2CYF0_9ACTN|nr:hypothetical protein [Actinomadura sp. J1-007]MWK39602.1 hypothetical protein [Actinomadura sp. J1-007]
MTDNPNTDNQPGHESAFDRVQYLARQIAEIRKDLANAEAYTARRRAELAHLEQWREDVMRAQLVTDPAGPDTPATAAAASANGGGEQMGSVLSGGYTSPVPDAARAEGGAAWR